MKRIVVLMLALTLSIVGCAKQRETPQYSQESAKSQQSADTASEAQKEQEWHFTVETETRKSEYKADDGTVVATASYEHPVLKLENANGELFAGSAPERGVTTAQLAACKTFNDATVSTGLLDVDLEETGREVYKARKENGEDTPPIGNETAVSETNLKGELLSVLVSDHSYLGGAHPSSGLRGWSFDLGRGEFITLRSLTDRYNDLKKTLVSEIAAQIETSEEKDYYYEEWYETLSQKEEFEFFLGEKGMKVWFQEYDLAPHALGVPLFDIPYASISRFLNAYGERLLALNVETRVIGDFHEAQEQWSWLESGAPLDYGDERIGVFDGMNTAFYRVSDPRAQTLDGLKSLLAQRVDRTAVEAQVEKTPALREFDGKLYMYPAGRGDDLTLASVDYEARMDADSQNGRVIVTIHRQDFDETTSEWKPNGSFDVHEFPFTLRDGHAVFATMEILF